MDGTLRRQLICQTQFSRSEYSLPSSVSDNEEYTSFLGQHLIIIFVPRNQNHRLRNKFIQKSSLSELKLESSCVSPTRNAVQNSLPDFMRLQPTWASSDVGNFSQNNLFHFPSSVGGISVNIL